MEGGSWISQLCGAGFLETLTPNSDMLYWKGILPSSLGHFSPEVLGFCFMNAVVQRWIGWQAFQADTSFFQ